MDTKAHYQSTPESLLLEDDYSKQYKPKKAKQRLSPKLIASLLIGACVVAILFVGRSVERAEAKAFYGYVPLAKEMRTEVILSARPKHTKDTPKAFAWNNVHGKDYLTASHNQHQPYNYCGACWVFGSVAVIDDRLNIIDPHGTTFSGAHQTLINCGPNYENGCGGGDANEVFKWVHENGLPETSCNNYMSKNNKCDALGRCQICAPPPGGCSEKPEGTYTIAVIDEYGSIKPPESANLQDLGVIAHQVKRMKAEIHKRGPIACGIICTPKMVAYAPLHPASLDSFPYPPHVMTFDGYGNSCKEGNLAKSNDDILSCIDHIVEVVGWGFDKGTEYWLIRNSWGTWWGEDGFFRVEVGKQTLGIESGCDWAVPRIINKPRELLEFKELKEQRQKNAN